MENPKIYFFLPQSKIGASSSLESSMKRFLREFELNQNKSKHIKINEVFDPFTSEAYTEAILSRNLQLLQLSLPKQLTKKNVFSDKYGIFKLRFFSVDLWFLN